LDEEDQVLLFEAGLLQNEFEVLAKVVVRVALLDVQLDELTVGDEGGKLHDGVFARAVKAN